MQLVIKYFYDIDFVFYLTILKYFFYILLLYLRTTLKIYQILFMYIKIFILLIAIQAIFASGLHHA